MHCHPNDIPYGSVAPGKTWPIMVLVSDFDQLQLTLVACYPPPFTVPMRGSTYRKNLSLDFPDESLITSKSDLGEFNLLGGSRAQTSSPNTGRMIRNRRNRGKLLRKGVMTIREPRRSLRSVTLTIHVLILVDGDANVVEIANAMDAS